MNRRDIIEEIEDTYKSNVQEEEWRNLLERAMFALIEADAEIEDLTDAVSYEEDKSSNYYWRIRDLEAEILELEAAIQAAQN